MGIVQEIEGGGFRCKCNWKRCGKNWQEYNYRRHMAGQCHQNWMRTYEERGFEQATYAEIAGTKAKREADHLQKVGMRSQASTDTDVPFRKDTVKSFLGTGVPLLKLQGLRTYLQHNCKKSIGGPRHLNGYKYS